MSTASRCVFAVCSIQLLTLLEGKVQKGVITLGGVRDSTNNWQFVSKFGYGTGTGDYQIRFRIPHGASHPDYGTAEFNVILDEDWPKAQAKSDCGSRHADARKAFEVGFSNPGEWGYWEPGTVAQNVRPHIWYFAISKCHEDLAASPLVLEYELVMKQPGGSEFSIEMRGMMTLNGIVLVFLVVFLVRYINRCRAFASSAGKLHQVIWVLSGAIALQFAAQSLHTLHLWSYQYDGAGIAVVDLLSEVLFMLSQVMQTTLLIAIAMGYTLLPSKNDCMFVVKCIALMSLTIHATLVSFGKMQEESSSKFHENEGPIGWVLLSVRLMLYGLFVFSTQASQREGGLRLHDFLQRFCIVGSMYFLAYPVLFVVVQVFAAYLQHPIMQIGLITMQTASNVCLAELFLARGAYFKVSALGSSLLPGSAGAFDKLS